MTVILSPATSTQQAQELIVAAFAQIADAYAETPLTVLSVQPLHVRSEPVAVWEVQYNGSLPLADGDWQLDALEARLDADVYATRDYRLFVSSLTGEEQNPALAPAVHAATARTWFKRWRHILASSMTVPKPAMTAVHVLRAGNSSGIRSMPFIVPAGSNPAVFQKYEDALRAALGATFLTVTPFVRDGAPEPHAFTVSWSLDPAPWEKPWEFTQQVRVQHILWQARLNTVFDLLGWSRPTLTQVWLACDAVDLEIDLYGLTVASDLMDDDERVRQMLGAKALHVDEARLGCTLSLAF